MAKKKEVSGWHSMRKAQLVAALTKLAKSQKAKAKKSSLTKKKSAARTQAISAAISAKSKPAASRNGKSKTKKPVIKMISTAAKQRNPRIAREIQMANAVRNQRNDLATQYHCQQNGQKQKDRVILMVRDAYWLHACWEITRQSVQRAKAAMAEQWHTAKPILRLLELDSNNNTNSAETVARDIKIHGDVRNWYVEVQDPPKSYRIAIGYLSSSGRFHALARSNNVTTPSPSASDEIDENWTDVADNFEKIYAQSGGYTNGKGGDLQELFEERLRRPMGSPLETHYGLGAERILNRQQELPFEVDVEMIIYGSTKPDAHVMLAGEPIKLRPDGSFTVRLSMPDHRQVLPVVACSADGVEQRTIVLAIERNTKTMEPKIRDPSDI